MTTAVVEQTAEDTQGRVLIVDDDPDFAGALVDLLAGEGYRPSVAHDQQSALTEVESHRAEVALIDVRLGRDDGLQTLRQLRAAHPTLVCIAMTAYAELDSAVEALQAGAYDYLCKPFTEVDLFGALQRSFRGVELAREREHAVVALRNKNLELEQIFRAIPDAIVYADIERRIIQVNEAFTRLFGYLPDEVLGEPTRIIYTSDESYTQQGRIRYNVAAPEQYGIYEIEYRKKNGDVFVSETVGTPVRDSQGTTIGFLGIVRDITDRKRTEDEHAKLESQLRHSQKMEAIGQLAGGVAHDFNNLLTAIFGNVELAQADIQAGLPNPQRTAEALSQVQASAQRAASLTRQLLAFSRRQVSQPRIVNLNHTLIELEKMLRRLLTENIALDVVCQQQLHNVRIDPGQLEQIIMNLAVNARDAMPTGGRLTLETQNTTLDQAYVATRSEVHAGNYVLLAVSDTGCGIDAATRERIFEPFFTTKSMGQGTGLGLATVYGIIKQAGGHIAVYSEPNQGSTFRVYLPAVDENTTQTNPGLANTETPQGNETILVCEDDPAVRQLTTRMLEQAGYAVLAARSGAEARTLVADQPAAINLLLTDVIMPDCDGRSLAQQLQQIVPELRVLYVSGYTANVIVHHGVLDEGVEFLEKPFTSRTLLTRVREVLDKPTDTHQP